MSTLNIILPSAILAIFFACNQHSAADKKNKQDHHITDITDTALQQTLARKIASIQENAIQNDTTAFLFLPLDASCPTCRDKTIDSILKYSKKIGNSHFVVVTSSSRKSIQSHFGERNTDVLFADSNITFDITNKALKADLVYENPVIYYAAGNAVFRKVNCEPNTIKKDLKRFFHDL